MIKTIRFMVSWTIGIYIMYNWVFKLIIDFKANQAATAIVCGMLVTTFTVVVGVITTKE